MSNAKMAVAAYAGEKAGAYYYHYDFVWSVVIIVIVIVIVIISLLSLLLLFGQHLYLCYDPTSSGMIVGKLIFGDHYSTWPSTMLWYVGML